MNTPIHPGEYLKEMLDELNMTLEDLRDRLNNNIPKIELKYVIEQKLRLQPDVALFLGKLFNQSPRYWLNLQMEYDLQVLEPIFQSELDKIVPVEFCSPKENS